MFCFSNFTFFSILSSLFVGHPVCHPGNSVQRVQSGVVALASTENLYQKWVSNKKLVLNETWVVWCGHPLRSYKVLVPGFPKPLNIYIIMYHLPLIMVSAFQCHCIAVEQQIVIPFMSFHPCIGHSINFFPPLHGSFHSFLSTLAWVIFSTKCMRQQLP